MIDKINLSRRGLLRGAAALPAASMLGTAPVASAAATEVTAAVTATAMVPRSVALFAAAPSLATSFMSRALNFLDDNPEFDPRKSSPDEIAEILVQNSKGFYPTIFDFTPLNTSMPHKDLCWQDLTLENVKSANDYIGLEHWKLGDEEIERVAENAQVLGQIFANPQATKIYLDAVRKSAARYLFDHPEYLPPLGSQDRSRLLKNMRSLGEFHGAERSQLQAMRTEAEDAQNKKVAEQIAAEANEYERKTLNEEVKEEPETPPPQKAYIEIVARDQWVFRIKLPETDRSVTRVDIHYLAMQLRLDATGTIDDYKPADTNVTEENDRWAKISTSDTFLIERLKFTNRYGLHLDLPPRRSDPVPVMPLLTTHHP